MGKQRKGLLNQRRRFAWNNQQTNRTVHFLNLAIDWHSWEKCWNCRKIQVQLVAKLKPLKHPMEPLPMGPFPNLQPIVSTIQPPLMLPSLLPRSFFLPTFPALPKGCTSYWKLKLCYFQQLHLDGLFPPWASSKLLPAAAAAAAVLSVAVAVDIAVDVEASMMKVKTSQQRMISTADIFCSCFFVLNWTLGWHCSWIYPKNKSIDRHDACFEGRISCKHNTLVLHWNIHSFQHHTRHKEQFHVQPYSTWLNCHCWTCSIEFVSK